MSTPVVLFVSLLLFMIVGVPVAWSLSLSCIAALLTMDGMPLVLLTQRVFTGANNFSFLAVPAFIIAGEVMSQGGISKRLVDMTSVLLGRVRGSLGIISVVASTIFAALSGSATATTAAIGGLMYPEMERRGYPKDFSAAVQAIGGTLGPVIPPSLMMIFYGVATGEPITKLLMSGVVPGIEEINSTQNKDARIQSLQPFVKNGYIKFSKKHKTLLKQMTEYPMGKNDDAPDGLQMAVKLALDVKTGRRVDYRSVIARALDFRRGAYYRRVTFKRTNSAPTISGQDKALGLKNGSFAENYTVSDVEGDNVVVTEFVDDVQIRSYQATLGQQETIELTREKWLSLTNGQHQLRIEAVDGNFATSVRVFSFSKKETVIKFELAAPEETDAAATKVLVTPTWKIEGAVAKVEACNNGFDAVPTWEDITAMVQINRVYNFTNKTKTASKWGVNIRFTITKNEGFEGEVSISGFGGAYE